MIPEHALFLQQLATYDNCDDDFELAKKVTVVPWESLYKSNSHIGTWQEYSEEGW